MPPLRSRTVGGCSGRCSTATTSPGRSRRPEWFTRRDEGLPTRRAFVPSLRKLLPTTCAIPSSKGRIHLLRRGAAMAADSTAPARRPPRPPPVDERAPTPGPWPAVDGVHDEECRLLASLNA